MPIISGEENIHPAHASLHDVMRKIGNNHSRDSCHGAGDSSLSCYLSIAVYCPRNSADKVKILRDAYARLLRDSELLAEAKKSNLDVDPTSGEDLQILIKDLMNQTGPVIDRVKNLLR